MAYIEIDGLREFNQAVRRSVDRDLGKRVGQANKKVGQYVIDHLSPSPNASAVGAGRGAAVRPSASKREVLLRVGGSHRAAAPANPSSGVKFPAVRQWGVKFTGRVGTPRPPRPHIQGTVEDNLKSIIDFYGEAMADALDPAFAETS